MHTNLLWQETSKIFHLIAFSHLSNHFRSILDVHHLMLISWFDLQQVQLNAMQLSAIQQSSHHRSFIWGWLILQVIAKLCKAGKGKCQCFYIWNKSLTKTAFSLTVQSKQCCGAFGMIKESVSIVLAKTHCLLNNSPNNCTMLRIWSRSSEPVAW